MKRPALMFAAIACISLGACNFTANKKEEVKTKPVTSKDNTTLNGAVIKNDIDIDVTGVKLKSAYLVDADYNPLPENKARVGEKIYVVLKMDTGWVKENGKSFIGASERILTSAGRVVVSADDIFKDYELKGLDAKDAKVVSLSAVITQADPGVNNFEVQFRVWDKKSAAEVKGKYYFSLK
ncbi:MAG: hypothetical protein JNM14_04215 [Ferruginibacter sp.]|nr:hypothetical protein [Ferruginibacter sp.]